MLYFVVFPPQQAKSEREGEGEMARVVPIVWRSSFDGVVGGWPVGQPLGFALPSYAGRVAGSAVSERP